MYDHTFCKLANYQIGHQATHKVCCRPGDCICSLQSSSGVCVGTYGLTYSLYHPRGCSLLVMTSTIFFNMKCTYLIIGHMWVCVCVVDTWSQQGHPVSRILSKFANHQIRHQVTHKVGCQPGDCIWSLELPQGFVWVCMG